MRRAGKADRRWLRRGVGALALGMASMLLGLGAGAACAQAAGTVLWHWDGAADDVSFGRALASAGDVNGDGVPDVLVGAPYASPGGRLSAGRVYVFSGADGQVLQRFEGERSGDVFGWALASAGDVNGDGVPDVLVGAPAMEPGRSKDPGRAYVLSGADGRVLWRVEGEVAGDHLGRSVAGVGDVNGDGVPDVLVGAPYASAVAYGAGRAYLLSGADGRRLWHLDGQERATLGHAVASAGDLNADAVPDVLVASPGALPNGSVYALSGTDGRLLRRFDGEVQSQGLGWAVAGAGDVNGDGVPDVIVSASTRWPVYVFSGADGQVLFRFDWRPEELPGYAVAGAGDVDGDGVPDILAGAIFAEGPQAPPIAGSVFVWSGADGRLLWRVDGTQPGGEFGYAVASAGDLDGDGRAEILAGAPYAGVPDRPPVTIGSAFAIGFKGEPPPPGVPDIRIDPRYVNFGPVPVTDSTSYGLLLRNDGGADLQVLDISIPVPPIYVTMEPVLRLPFTVRPGQEVWLTVAFGPEAPGRYRQTIRVRSNDPNEPVVTIIVKGRGVNRRRPP